MISFGFAHGDPPVRLGCHSTLTPCPNSGDHLSGNLSQENLYWYWAITGRFRPRLEYYNNERIHQGKMCYGRTPI